MTAKAAGGMLMWLAGLALGVGALKLDAYMLSAGSALSLLGAVYIQAFVKGDD